MRVAITGASGLLGKYLIATAPQGVDLTAITHTNSITSSLIPPKELSLDLTQPDAIREIIRLQPNVIIHAAGEGRVDAVENRIDDFRTLNLNVAQALASWCGANDAQFIFISSNAVFGGLKPLYSDYSQPDPINDYGRLKAQTETAVSNVNPSALIVRPILLYGLPSAGGRSNPAMAWIKSLGEGNPVAVVDDVVTQPLWALDAAQAIWQALRENLSGPVNVSGGEAMSLFAFAHKVASVFGLNQHLIHSARSSDFPSIAPRPLRTCFDLARLKVEVGFQPHSVLQGLSAFREEFEQHN